MTVLRADSEHEIRTSAPLPGVVRLEVRNAEQRLVAAAEASRAHREPLWCWSRGIPKNTKDRVISIGRDLARREIT